MSNAAAPGADAIRGWLGRGALFLAVAGVFVVTLMVVAGFADRPADAPNLQGRRNLVVPLFHADPPPGKPAKPQDNQPPARPPQDDPPSRPLVQADPKNYPWLTEIRSENLLVNRIDPPAGYVRQAVRPGTFAWYLQMLPLKPGCPEVHLFDGSLKANQEAQFAVLDLDTGSKDLQQCADAVIRLRAEYLWATGQQGKIAFNFSNGTAAAWTKFAAGQRPVFKRKGVSWKRSGDADSSYASFRKYLEMVFGYAGTGSLAAELGRVKNVKDMQIGDVFVIPSHGRRFGHAVIVVDMAVNGHGQKVFMLAQSYMPAQEMHVLKNAVTGQESPWYDLDFGSTLKTPEWTFTKKDLRRFR